MTCSAHIEELSFNALPAVRTLNLDGWILRFAGGYSKRANSVNPLYPPAGSLHLSKKIAISERLYRLQGLAPTFKLTSDAYHPASLDHVLAEAGYRRIAPTSVQTMSLSALAVPECPAGGMVRCAPGPAPAWSETVARIGAFDEARQSLFNDLLRQIRSPSCFALLELEGKGVAAGYAVARAGYVGLYQIGTDSDYRRRGYARATIHHLLRWGQRHGAHVAYLQVTQENLPALRLYQELGFREQYHYWYRVAGSSPA